MVHIRAQIQTHTHTVTHSVTHIVIHPFFPASFTGSALVMLSMRDAHTHGNVCRLVHMRTHAQSHTRAHTHTHRHTHTQAPTLTHTVTHPFSPAGFTGSALVMLFIGLARMQALQLLPPTWLKVRVGTD